MSYWGAYRIPWRPTQGSCGIPKPPPPTDGLQVSEDCREDSKLNNSLGSDIWEDDEHSADQISWEGNLNNWLLACSRTLEVICEMWVGRRTSKHCKAVSLRGGRFHSILKVWHFGWLWCISIDDSVL